MPRPACREHRQDRPVQAARHGRRVLARRREATDAPARLRHGVGDAGRARRLRAPSRRGPEAGPPSARRPARPVLVPRCLAGLGVLAPEGAVDLAHPRGLDARAAGAPGLPGSVDADRRVRAAVAPVGPLGPVSGQHVPRRVREPDVQPQADELPGVDVHLSIAPALVSRSSAAVQRVRSTAPERAVRDVEWPDARPPVHPGRRASLRPAGPADRRDRRAPGRGSRGVRLVRAAAAVHVRDQARQGDRRSGAVGACGAADPRGVRRGGHQL